MELTDDAIFFGRYSKDEIDSSKSSFHLYRDVDNSDEGLPLLPSRVTTNEEDLLKLVEGNTILAIQDHYHQ